MVGEVRYLADHGYAAFDINYRLLGDLGPGATLPDAIAAAREDLDRAVEHVVAESKTYRIAPDRLAVGGGSAGAITVLLATYGETRSFRMQTNLAKLATAVQRGKTQRVFMFVHIAQTPKRFG